MIGKRGHKEFKKGLDQIKKDAEKRAMDEKAEVNKKTISSCKVCDAIGEQLNSVIDQKILKYILDADERVKDILYIGAGGIVDKDYQAEYGDGLDWVGYKKLMKSIVTFTTKSGKEITYLFNILFRSSEEANWKYDVILVIDMGRRRPWFSFKVNRVWNERMFLEKIMHTVMNTFTNNMGMELVKVTEKVLDSVGFPKSLRGGIWFGNEKNPNGLGYQVTRIYCMGETEIVKACGEDYLRLMDWDFRRKRV